jgi:hypothetical protein
MQWPWNLIISERLSFSSSYVPVDLISVIVIIVFVFAVAMHGRQVEWMER